MKKKILILTLALIMVLTTVLGVYATTTLLEKKKATIPTKQDNAINLGKIASVTKHANAFNDSSNADLVMTYGPSGKQLEDPNGGKDTLQNYTIVAVKKKDNNGKPGGDAKTLGNGSDPFVTITFTDTAKVYDVNKSQIVNATVKLEVLQVKMQNRVRNVYGRYDDDKDNNQGGKYGTGWVSIINRDEDGNGLGVFAAKNDKHPNFSQHVWYGKIDVKLRYTLTLPSGAKLNTSKVIIGASDIDQCNPGPKNMSADPAEPSPDAHSVPEGVTFESGSNYMWWGGKSEDGKQNLLHQEDTFTAATADREVSGNNSWYCNGVMAQFPPNKTSTTVTYHGGFNQRIGLQLYTGYEESAPFRVKKTIDPESNNKEGEHVGLEGFKFILKNKYDSDAVGNDPNAYQRTYSGVTNANGEITSWTQEIPKMPEGEAQPVVSEIPIGDYYVSEDTIAIEEFEKKYTFEKEEEYLTDGGVGKKTYEWSWESITPQNKVVSIQADVNNSLEWVNKFNYKLDISPPLPQPFKIIKKVDPEGETKGEHVGVEGFKFSLKTTLTMKDQETGENKEIPCEYTGTTDKNGEIAKWLQVKPEKTDGEEQPTLERLPEGKYIVTEDTTALEEFEKKYTCHEKKKDAETFYSWTTVTPQETEIVIKEDEINILEWVNRFSKQVFKLDEPIGRIYMSKDLIWYGESGDDDLETGETIKPVDTGDDFFDAKMAIALILFLFSIIVLIIIKKNIYKEKK